MFKTSLVCLLLLIYMGLFYFSRKRLPLHASRVFLCYYVFSLILIIFDMLTLYTVNHMEKVPAIINDVAHNIYLFLINFVIYLNFLYLRSLVEIKLNFSKSLRIIHSIPFLVTSILILILPLDYIHGITTNYSMGAKVYALYSNIIITNIAILYYSIRYWQILNREKRLAIIASVPIFFAVTVINITLPEALFTIVYVILTSVGLLMSSENSEKYIDGQTLMFNQYAFDIVLREELHSQKKAFCVIFTMSEAETVHTSIDWKLYVTYMKTIQKHCKFNFYRVSDNGFVLLAPSKDLAEKYTSNIMTYINEKNVEGIEFATEQLSLDFGMPIDAVMSHIIKTCINAVNKMAIYDFLTGIYNRNYFETKLKAYRDEKINCFYFIADLNNLKEANDIFGHSMGDELLQTAAQHFKICLGDNGAVFRQGGDEFAIILLKNNQENPDKQIEEFLTMLENHRVSLNKVRRIPLSYAIGYSNDLSDKGLEEADKMMYENKKQMKVKNLTGITN